MTSATTACATPPIASLSVAQRRRLHERAADVLEQVWAHDLDPVCGQLAAHFSQAGLPAAAVGYYQRAGGGRPAHLRQCRGRQLLPPGVAAAAPVARKPGA